MERAPGLPCQTILSALCQTGEYSRFLPSMKTFTLGARQMT